MGEENSKVNDYSLSAIDEIQRDEELRYRLRKTLDEKEGPRGVWGFLNSPLGIWLLSSVVLGSFSFLFSQWQASAATRARQSEQAVRIRTEIGYRMQDYASHIAEAKEETNPTKRSALYESIDKIDYNPGFPLFPEYKDISIMALVLNLREIVPENDKANVEQVLQNLKAMNTILIRDRKAAYALPPATARGDLDQLAINYEGIIAVEPSFKF
ncbi:MAG: hypothetical protein QOJ65_1223 [Fimbriimonadaceae bacterium]|nr:hypothetical protein [Fimbriimonadaceae bacterium]